MFLKILILEVYIHGRNGSAHKSKVNRAHSNWDTDGARHQCLPDVTYPLLPVLYQTRKDWGALSTTKSNWREVEGTCTLNYSKKLSKL